MDAAITDQILSSRRVSEDGSIVTYDLSWRDKLLQPHDLADALSEVVVRKDSVSWFTVDGSGAIKFEPSYRVEVLIPKDDKRGGASIIFRFHTRSVDTSVKESYREFVEGLGKEETSITSEGLDDGLRAVFIESGAKRSGQKKNLKVMTSEIRNNVDFKTSRP